MDISSHYFKTVLMYIIWENMLCYLTELKVSAYLPTKLKYMYTYLINCTVVTEYWNTDLLLLYLLNHVKTRHTSDYITST